MTSDRWHQVDELFQAALERPADARAEFLARACAGDEWLRREVDELLAFHDRARSASFLAGPPARLAAEAVAAGCDADAAATEPFAAGGGPLRVGTVVGGKYRVEALVGSGGMGAVYRATHVHLERAVALKAIRAELLADPAATERFRREAVAVARLRHPHIVTVHDFGVAEPAGAYIVMELLEGHSLRRELALRERLDVAEALALVGQISAAVSAAHRAGVVHRDLKPDNIFLERRDGAAVVKVVDFGLAKLEAILQSRGEGPTQRGTPLGTPAYMSPEQCRGEEADARSDVYALGCVTYEMLTGERPFGGKTVWALVYQHVNDEPRRPSDLVPELPAAIDEAVLRALAKAPGERPQTAEAFAEALGVAAVTGATPVSPVATPVIDGTATAAMPPTNLPHAVTRFVGRERQIDEVCGWLARARLVTLTGPGGIGKTRLALEAAARVLDEYADGVWLVELAALADPALVARTVGAALGVREQGGRTEMESLEAWLRNRRVLVLLDNCEHLVGACAELVARLLGVSAGLRVLATSREALAIAGEAVWPVPTLGASGTDCEAVRLFADRAAFARPGFETTDAVAELVGRLEGIPLAIELAAARVRALTVEQILARLDDRFRLLAGGSRTAPSRQQTLRATLDWSYDLLTEEERTLLRRLSVFAGGWTLETAEAVAEWDPTADAIGSEHGDTLDLLSRLVDKSLVVAPGHGPEERFRMLEVVREYARERLGESGEAADVARRHADVFLEMARASVTKFVGAQQAEWLARLEAEHDNMRAALGWLLEHDPEKCLRLADAVEHFWSFHGYFVEGSRWLAAALAASDPGPSIPRLKALRAAGDLAWRKGDLAVAHAHLEESMRMAREAGNAREIAWSAFHLALVIQQQGDPQASRPYLQESLARAREIGDDRLVGNALNSLGEAARIEGDWATARPFYEQSLEVHRRMGHPAGTSVTLCNLGATLCEAGALEAARSCYVESLSSLRELGNVIDISVALDGLAAVAAKRGEWERAARLAGAAAALRESIAGELEPADRRLRECCLRDVREHLDEAAFEAASAEGRAMARDRAIDDALSM